jgi:hypothetical protein
VAACGAAAPEGGRIGEAGSGPPEAAVGADPLAADAGADGAPKCPHGALEDPHHGFVRCLTPDEADAGYRPPSQSPADGGGDASTDGGGADGGPAPVSGPPPRVEVGTPVFENGDVQTVQKTLGKLSGDFAKCIAENGGLTAATGSIKLQFLVRVRERAEGVEVLGQKNVSPQAASCVKGLLKNRWVGTPSADPVGVTVTLSLKAPK